MINLDKIDVSNFLPHRSPFLMVDKVLTLNDEHVSTSFKIKKDCLLVEDDYFNEIGLIENAAQTCSSIVGKSFFNDDDIEGEGANLIGFISAVKKVTVFSCPKVDSTIISSARLTSRFDTNNYSICSLECNIHEGASKLLSCEMNLVIKELK
ncbi:ABC transporter permease [Flavivirga abyssicola]|uniref:ABC transporter permease n=1 Tax=Flavivirga abyssicola TaxID=3063533 RepID=UPI0026E07E03|nr:ABC transporter permease [Flavivirga sp. MEBiC07777]WVK14977.1 ABC transporter permease [Flavivirga sp. MEBiC07777]